MRFLLFVPVFLVLLGGCYSAEKKQDDTYVSKDRDKFSLSALCPERTNEAKWRKQTVDQMRESRKIPSVDFEFDGIVLTPSSYEVLDKVAEIMNADHSLKLIIEGHTDEVGTDEYNDWLSSARSNAIKSYLCSRGVYPDYIKTYGHGKRRPLIKLEDDPEARACNRRIEFTLTTRHWETVY